MFPESISSQMGRCFSPLTRTKRSRPAPWAWRPSPFEARTEAPAKAGVALATIREIFIVEREVGELDAQTRSRVRKERLCGPLSALKRRLDAWSTTARPQSALGKAITYARNRGRR